MLVHIYRAGAIRRHILPVKRRISYGFPEKVTSPLFEELVEGYNEYNPNAQIEVTETDSTQGLNAAMQGKCDLAMSSRELESYEKELLEYEVFAKDGIAVIVNKENPLENLSLEQLKEIFDGSLKNWDEL